MEDDDDDDDDTKNAIVTAGTPRTFLGRRCEPLLVRPHSKEHGRDPPEGGLGVWVTIDTNFLRPAFTGVSPPQRASWGESLTREERAVNRQPAPPPTQRGPSGFSACPDIPQKGAGLKDIYKAPPCARRYKRQPLITSYQCLHQNGTPVITPRTVLRSNAAP